MADGSGYRYPIPTLEKKDYFANVVLPKDLTCKHCVFRLESKTQRNPIIIVTI